MDKAIGLLSWALLLSTSAAAQQAAFRVETQVQTQPVKRTLTLFSEGVGYDFALDESGAITLIDPKRNRIVLLDPVREVKATLDMQELLGLVSKARQEVAQSGLAGLLESAKKTRFDEQTQTVYVGDEYMSYQATLQAPAQENMAAQYAQFADWSARLNAVFEPHFPPYVRLELNRLVAEVGKLPKRITRTTQHQEQKSTIECILTANWRISTEDNEKIRRVGEMLVKFKDVTQAEYFAQKPRLISSGNKLTK